MRVLAPAVGSTIEQPPAATAATQELPAPSLTVTLPVGVPAPGAVTATDQETATGWPATEGSGLSAVTVVVVLALLTTRAAVEESRDPQPSVTRTS